MSEIEGSGQFPAGDGEEGSRAPHRGIGTPPPARARTLLETPPPEDSGPPRWLPAEPSTDPGQAKRAERVVAALFVLSMLASIGFIAAYLGLQVHSVGATLLSNLALGISMSVAFGALAVGAVIWVRYPLTSVEHTQARHPPAPSTEP